MNRHEYISDDHKRVCLTIVPGSRWKKKLNFRPSPIDVELVIISKNNIITNKDGMSPEIEWGVFVKEQQPDGYVTICGGPIGYFLERYEPH